MVVFRLAVYQSRRVTVFIILVFMCGFSISLVLKLTVVSENMALRKQ